MKILTRYIFKEMLGPPPRLHLLHLHHPAPNLFDVAGMIIRRSLPASTVGRLLFLSLPHIIVLTVPMSLLFGILIAVGRLSSDSEIIAMRASGISARAIYRPVFLFSFLVFPDQSLPDEQRAAARQHGAGQPAGGDLHLGRRARAAPARLLHRIRKPDDLRQRRRPRNGRWKGVFVADSRLGDSKER